jgi:hypothetical protein
VPKTARNRVGWKERKWEISFGFNNRLRSAQEDAKAGEKRVQHPPLSMALRPAQGVRGVAKPNSAFGAPSGGGCKTHFGRPQGWGIQGDAPSPLAGWDRFASPHSEARPIGRGEPVPVPTWDVTPRLQTSLAAESAALIAHQDGAPITSPRSRPSRAFRAFEGVRRAKPGGHCFVPAIHALGTQLVSLKVAEEKDSTQVPPPAALFAAAQRAATAHSSVAVASAEGQENLPSTYFVPMALRTRSAGEKSTLNDNNQIPTPFDLQCSAADSNAAVRLRKGAPSRSQTVLV